MRKQGKIGQCVALPMENWTPKMVENALNFKDVERQKIIKEIETQEGYSVEELFRLLKKKP